MRLIFLPLLLSLFAFSAFAQKGWRGIVPLKTTREQVEKKFGKSNRTGFYEL
jgi:hypothetical protein